MMVKGFITALLCPICLLFTSCHTEEKIRWEKLNRLPEPVSNNAVAAVEYQDRGYIYSFMGLGSGKTYRDIHSKSYKYDILRNEWSRIADVPGDSGRLAATAVTVDKQVYLFGGYTIAEDGSEKSMPEVYRLNPENDTFSKVTEMPVPVDDAVSLVFRDRYIYLVSGWHDTGNVDNVQLYDTIADQWKQATSFPGSPVFGHAGGIAGSEFIISDGVKVVQVDEKARTFQISGDSWLGQINPEDITEISWTKLPAHPGPPKYRMASIGLGNKVLFAGGSGNPYNYNGIGYNGEPSEPDSMIFMYDLEARQWEIAGYQPSATMDHRGLASNAGWLYLIGGMKNNQRVSAEHYRFKMPE